MEVQIKRAVRAGNSSAVILPRAWLDKEVRVELAKKTPETMLIEVISILKNYIKLEEVTGIYLTGSYARGEEKEDSDIDILVVTSNIDKEMIREGIYNILIVSESLIRQKLSQDLFPIGQMIKEAEPLLNSGYLNSIDIKVTKKNIKWYIDTTEEKLKLIWKIVNNARKANKKYLDARVGYTLVLRIRTMYIAKKLIENKDYSNRDFLKIIKNISKGAGAYEGYLAVKNNLEAKNKISVEEISRLYGYLGFQLNEIKNLIKFKKN